MPIIQEAASIALKTASVAVPALAQNAPITTFCRALPAKPAATLDSTRILIAFASLAAAIAILAPIKTPARNALQDSI